MGIVSFIIYLPDAINLLTAGLKLWKEVVASGKERDVLNSTTEALNHARQSKDTTKITDILNSVITTGGVK